jgi:hypothetical protein
MDKFIDKFFDVLKLAALVSNTTKADAFVEYSGHVDLLSIRIYPEGYECDGYKYDFYGNQFDSVSEAKLDDAIGKMTALLDKEEQK